jgi:hypothetical protein
LAGWLGNLFTLNSADQRAENQNER